MRLICTLALTCLAAACVPPKAVEVAGQDPVTPKPKPEKTVAATTPAEPVSFPTGRPNPVMKINPGIYRLPERKDMVPTAPPQTTADRGPNVMVPAPKPVNE